MNTMTKTVHTRYTKRDGHCQCIKCEKKILIGDDYSSRPMGSGTRRRKPLCKPCYDRRERNRL